MPNGPTKLEKLQRAFTEEFKAELEKYRNARILHAALMGDGTIVLSNPYWEEALGYSYDDLHHQNIYDLVSNRKKMTSFLMGAMVQDVTLENIVILNKRGQQVKLLCWMGRLIEKSTGVWVSNFTAVLVDE